DVQHRWLTRKKNTTIQCSAIRTMSSLCPTACIPTTYHRKCNIRTRSLWTLTVSGTRPFLAACADMVHWMKGLVGYRNCQKNGNTVWAGVTGPDRVHLVTLEAEFFHFLD